jgi:hypothetical protein
MKIAVIDEDHGIVKITWLRRHRFDARTQMERHAPFRYWTTVAVRRDGMNGDVALVVLFALRDI